MRCQEKCSRVHVTEVIVSNTQVDHVGKVTSQAVISFKHHCIKYDMSIIGARVPQPLREKEDEPPSVQTNGRAGSRQNDVTRQIVLQGILAALTAKDTRESNWFMISIGGAPAVDNSLHKHQT